MDRRTRTIFVAVLILVSALLACTINIGGPAYPTPAIPISTEAVGELVQNLEAAVVAGGGTGQVTFVFTEPQLSSYLYYYLQKQANPLFTDPQVYLQDGEIRIHGTAQRGSLRAFIYIVLAAGIDDQGGLKIELTQADFGPLPVPAGLKDTLTAIIKEAYTGALGPVATGFRLESIQVANGTMVITGRVK